MNVHLKVDVEVAVIVQDEVTVEVEVKPDIRVVVVPSIGLVISAQVNRPQKMIQESQLYYRKPKD